MGALASFAARIDARHRVGFSFIVGLATFLLVHGHVRFWTASIVAWDMFAASVLLLAWTMIVVTPPTELRRRAQAQDLSRTLIFIFAVTAACASLVGVGFVLHTNKVNPQPHASLHLALALFAVATAWSLTHTVFGLRYAHTFYGDSDDPNEKEHVRGLEFPGEENPNYMDFAYFSIVIGMTFQVSDVQITSRDIRQLVLVHSILSFAFNTVILALAINTASSLL
ncbi:MAG: DUF1345 domain-containing protein [Chthoniobacterales bacterium]